MNAVEQVRSLFVPGGKVQCVANTYHQKALGRIWTVKTVGKSVWEPADDPKWRGRFPTHVRDVVCVDADSATWKIGREDHTVTYRRVQP